jgi:D-glycero-D-manno-heptose 1,7-bisphosphate phosphatase
MQKSIIFDVDGCIVQLIKRKRSFEDKTLGLYSPLCLEDVELVKNIVENINKLKILGYKIITIKNEPSLGRELSIKEFLKIHYYIAKTIRPDWAYYCPHRDKDKCECRKPKAGLFKVAIKDFDIDIKKSYAIGDNEWDAAPAKFLGFKTYTIKSNSSIDDIIKEIK